jgi:hypothetical protein
MRTQNMFFIIAIPTPDPKIILRHPNDLSSRPTPIF